MKKILLLTLVCSALVAVIGAHETAWAQQAPAPNATAAHLIVTVEPKHGSNAPVINREDVMVFEGHDRDTVTDWIPLQGDRAGLQLFILIDDESSTSLGSQLEDLRQFINAQPSSTKIGVAYMQNGIGRIIEEPTNDHAQAAKALRLPIGVGGANASPYFSLSDLAKKWPPGDERREVLMISDGIDRYYGSGDPEDPYLQAAIDDAVKAGILVSAIYTPGVGHYGHSYWQNYWGQIYLSELAEKTGGEAYYIGFTGAPVSFAPYLQDFERRLQHQYLLGFVPKPTEKNGWHKIRLRTEVPNVDLVSADRVWVSVER